MKKILYLLIGILILYSLYLGSYSVIHGELNFFNDVGRDFLLLQELDAKKIVFIGPRSNTSGLFHGPLWTYINYPAYLIGSGNPVVVAWFWMVLAIIFLITSFFIAKKLFGTLPALCYVLLLAVKLVSHINGVFHSESTFFVIPVLFFTMCMYVTTKKIRFLSLHLIATAALVQLNIGDGIPFLILSTLITFWLIIKHRLWKHFLSFLLLPLCFSNFILFDLRHNFQMTHALLQTGTSSKFFITAAEWISNRINNTISLQLIENSSLHQLLLIVIFIVVMIATTREIRGRTKLRPYYLLFVIYYFGYIILSYFNKGILLFHYTYLLIPLTTLWFTSYIRGKYMVLFAILFGIVYFHNLTFAKNYVNSLGGFMGKNPNSWIALSTAAKEVTHQQKGKEFGYYVFSPDSFAYQPRYAMIYNFKKSNSKAFEYVKKPVTYIIAQPPPTNDKYMDYKWWVRVPVGITKKPEKIIKLPSGYWVIKYNLTEEEQKIPHDRAIELGIHFR